MFYYPHSQPSYPLFLMPPVQQPPPVLLQTLSFALHSSLVRYQQTRPAVKTPENQMRPTTSTSLPTLPSTEPLLAPPKSEMSSNLSEKNSESQSPKIVPQLPAPSTMLPQPSSFQGDQESKNLADLPQFGLSGEERRQRFEDLLSRRVDKWPSCRRRKRSSRLVFCW